MTRRISQKGSALVYILIAIALVAAITATFMDNSSQQVSSQNTFNVATDLKSQIDFIRSSIQECVLNYPAGDSTSEFAALGLPNPPYPILPSNPYFDTPAANDLLRGIGCPGNPGNSNDHALIFGGSSGKFLPPHHKLFEEWGYYSGADGVFLITATNKTDSFLMTALTKLDDQYTECEADIITGPLTVTSDTPNACPAGYICFRVWMVTQPTAIYQGADELANCP